MIPPAAPLGPGTFIRPPGPMRMLASWAGVMFVPGAGISARSAIVSNTNKSSKRKEAHLAASALGAAQAVKKKHGTTFTVSFRLFTNYHLSLIPMLRPDAYVRCFILHLETFLIGCMGKWE